MPKKHSDEYDARPVIFTGEMPAPAFVAWTLLAHNSRVCEGPVDAMLNLLKELYEQVEKIDKKGDVY